MNIHEAPRVPRVCVCVCLCTLVCVYLCTYPTADLGLVTFSKTSEPTGDILEVDRQSGCKSCWRRVWKPLWGFLLSLYFCVRQLDHSQRRPLQAGGEILMTHKRHFLMWTVDKVQRIESDVICFTHVANRRLFVFSPPENTRSRKSINEEEEHKDCLTPDE